MKQKKTWIAALILVVLVVAAALVWTHTRQTAQQGGKHLTVEVVADDQTTAFNIQTDAEYLRQALEEQDLIEGTESQYGLYVTTVNGITADESQQEWWCFTRNGEQLNTGVDSTPIADGETYEITLTTGW